MHQKSITFIFLTSVLVFLCSCSYLACKDYYEDPDSYKEIWNLAGFRHGYDGISPFFPNTLENKEVEKFFCRYDQQLPVGEGVQVFLQIRYKDNEFRQEVERLAKISFRADEYFDESDFLVYALRLGENCSSEYAIIDEQEGIIIYIFLYFIPKSQIEIEHSLIPDVYAGYGDYLLESTIE